MASRRVMNFKRSAAQIKQLIDAIKLDITKQRELHVKRGDTFTSLTPEQLENKLRRSQSPMIVWQAWSNTAPLGGAISYDIGVTNPDPVPWSNLAVEVSVGDRNPIMKNDLFLSDRDERFPCLAQPPTLGFTLEPAGSPNVSKSFAFSLNIPNGVEKTGYLAMLSCNS